MSKSMIGILALCLVVLTFSAWAQDKDKHKDNAPPPAERAHPRLSADPGGCKIAQGGFNLSEYMLLNAADRRSYEDFYRDRPVAPLMQSNGMRHPWMSARDDKRLWHWAEEYQRQWDPITLQYVTPNFGHDMLP